jgi:hypothetical protein
MQDFLVVLYRSEDAMGRWEEARGKHAIVQ